MMRAKFILETLNRDTDDNGELTFRAVTNGSEENDKFFKYTPSGTIQMGVVNKDVLDMLEEGASYYVEFHQVESEPK